MIQNTFVDCSPKPGDMGLCKLSKGSRLWLQGNALISVSPDGLVSFRRPTGVIALRTELHNAAAHGTKSVQCIFR